MSSAKKTLERVLSGTADSKLRFSQLRTMMLSLGFDERVRGDHHIYSRSDVEEILNLQPARGLAKPYQVKQVRQIILRYRPGNEK